MGAGCYYTHVCNEEKAAWIDISEISQSDWDDVFWFKINDALVGINYEPCGNYKYRNGLFVIQFKQYDDNLVIYIEPRYIKDNYGYADKDKRYYLAMTNHNKAEAKIWKALQDYGFDLYIATGGYTSQKIGKLE